MFQQSQRTLTLTGPFLSPSFSNTEVFGKAEPDFCFLAVSENETVPPAVSLAGLFAPSEDTCGDSVLALVVAGVDLFSMVLKYSKLKSLWYVH